MEVTLRSDTLRDRVYFRAFAPHVPRFVIGLKLSIDEFVPGGSHSRRAHGSSPEFERRRDRTISGSVKPICDARATVRT